MQHQQHESLIKSMKIGRWDYPAERKRSSTGKVSRRAIEDAADLWSYEAGTWSYQYPLQTLITRSRQRPTASLDVALYVRVNTVKLTKRWILDPRKIGDVPDTTENRKRHRVIWKEFQTQKRRTGALWRKYQIWRRTVIPESERVIRLTVIACRVMSHWWPARVRSNSNK